MTNSINDLLARHTLIFTIVVVIFSLFITFFSEPYGNGLISTSFVKTLGKTVCLCIIALAMDVVWGYCGILSLGHFAFFGLGGYMIGMWLMYERTAIIVQEAAINELLPLTEAELSNAIGNQIFGVVGGYIAADDVICDAVRSFGSGFIFTTALPPALACGALASVQHLRRSSHERLAQQRQAAKLKAKLHEVGLPILEGDMHIIPIMVKNAAKCSLICHILLNDFGIYMQPINYPTVSVGSERLRLTPGPLHTDTMIDHLVDSLQKAFALAGDAQALQTG